jgi:hypothetical protein
MKKKKSKIKRKKNITEKKKKRIIKIGMTYHKRLKKKHLVVIYWSLFLIIINRKRINHNDQFEYIDK